MDPCTAHERNIREPLGFTARNVVKNTSGIYVLTCKLQQGGYTKFCCF